MLFVADVYSVVKSYVELGKETSKQTNKQEVFWMYKRVVFMRLF